MLEKWFWWILILTPGIIAETYNGYHVLRVKPSQPIHFEFLNWLQNDKDALVFKESRISSPFMEIAMPANTYQSVENVLRSMSPEILTTDLHKLISTVNPEHRRVTREEDVFDYSKFHPTASIHEFFRTLQIVYPQLLTLESIGTSSEGREMLLAKIGTKSTESSAKPSVWIDCGIHAREWISPPTCAYIAQEVLREQNLTGSGPLDKLDIYILPVANPDGYDYTFSTDRFWRKTRSKLPGSSCSGVDPNRNFNFHWSNSAELGASSNPCSETFAGTAPLTEPETKAMADYLVSLKPNLRAYLSFHSYGNQILHGWGYSTDFPDNIDQLRKLANIMAEGFAKERHTQFGIGGAGDALYVATGGSDDYAKGEAGAQYSYCIELGSGFVLPAEEILPSVRETYQGIKDALEYLAKEE